MRDYEPGDELPPGGGGGGGGGGTPAIPGTVVVSQTINKLRSDSALEIVVYVNLWAVDDLQVAGYIIIDDQVTQTMDDNLTLALTGARGSRMILAFEEPGSIPAGLHTITFSAVGRDPDGAITAKRAAILKITEFMPANL